MNIESTRGSVEGPARYGSCFSTAAVSVEALEVAEHAGVSWGLVLCLGLIPLVQVIVECHKTLHCLQKCGSDSYIICWGNDVPLGRTTLTEEGKSKSRSTSIRILAYKSRVIYAVGLSQWIGFLIMLAILDR